MLCLERVLLSHVGRCYFLTAMWLKLQVYCDVMPCRLVNVYRRVGRFFCLHLQGGLPLKASYSETLERSYQSTWRHVPGDWNLLFYVPKRELI